MKRRLQVMKFGGTSVGNAECIARAAKIVAQSAREGRCVAVVSAMSGVTNRLIEAARMAETGNRSGALAAIQEVRAQHESALNALLEDESERAGVRARLEAV